MEELVKLVSERTGLPPETAKVAVDTVLGYIKQSLPPPLAGMLDSVVGSGGASGTPGDLPGGLGGLFGKT